MTSVTTSYRLWFVNESGRPGDACVYLDASGVTTNLGPAILLAWMVQGANNGVMVRFDWQLDYVFLWVQYSPNRAQQVKAAALGRSIPLSNNEFGPTFGESTEGTSGSLAIQQDASIPADTSSLAGIGLHGAGTYASSFSPNRKSLFTPVATPPYRITFGDLSLEVNDRIDPANFPVSPGDVAFPPNVAVMTALLNRENRWTIQPGDPWSNGAIKQIQDFRGTIVYEAGRGIIAESEGGNPDL